MENDIRNTELRDTELREVLHGMIATSDLGADDAVAGVQRRVVRHRRNRRVATAASLVSVVIIASVVGVAITGRSHGKHHVNVTASSTAPAEPPRAPIVTDPDGVQSFGPIPLSTRAGSANVWTGSELVVWGGGIEAANAGLPGPDRQFTDGAAFDPATRKWRALSPSPLPASRRTSVGVLTDQGVVIVNGRATALWSPRDNSWRSLADAPAAVDDLAFTGTQVISASAHAILDPATGVWRAIPSLPNLDRKAVVWTGNELFAVGGPGDPFTSAVAYAYDPAGNAWRRLADPPAKLHAEALAADWDGKRVVVVNYDMQAYTYDPATNTWTTLKSVPARFGEWSPTLRASGGRSIAFMAGSVAVLDAADNWTPLPYGEIPAIETVIPTDASALFAIGRPAGEKVNSLAAIDLERLVDNAPRIQVGIASVAIPSGYSLTDATFDHDNGGAPFGADVVRVVLGRRVAPACTLSSSYGASGSGIPDAVPETVTNDGKPRQWFRDPAGRSWWFNEGGNTDSFKIVCDDAPTSRALIESTSLEPW